MSQSELLAQNRAVVGQLMWELRVFTLQQLSNAFHDKLGIERSDYLGDGQRIRDYVEEMTDFGVLEEAFGVYTCTPPVSHGFVA